MKPFLKESTIVFFERTDFDQLKPLNIIVIQKNKEIHPVVHRIIRIYRNKRIIVTKGDNSRKLDKPVNFNMVLGRVIAVKCGNKILRTNRVKEFYQFKLSQVYLLIRRLAYKFIYENTDILFTSNIYKLLIKKRKLLKKNWGIYLLDKKIAIRDQEHNNYTWRHEIISKNALFITGIEKYFNQIRNESQMNIKKNSELVFRNEGGEGLLYNPKTGEMKVLNETACLIYSLLDGKHSKKDIVNEIINIYDIDSTQAEDEVDSFIYFLKNNKLL